MVLLNQLSDEADEVKDSLMSLYSWSVTKLRYELRFLPFKQEAKLWLSVFCH